MRVLFKLLIVTAMLAALPRLASAQATTAATGPATDLKITITGVQGMAQVRDAEDQPWRKAEVGIIVGPGAEFRTGIKSAVRCVIPPDQTITIDRLGVMRVATAILQQGKYRTDILMPYGRTRYDIEEAGLEHESTLRSPSSTLAVRGTRVGLYDQPPFTPRAVSLTGRAIYGSAKHQVAFGGKGAGLTAIAADALTPAETAARVAVVARILDPKSVIEYTEAETRQLAFEVVDGGIRFDRLIIGGFRPPPTDLAAAGLLPGKLNFVATWTGFADIDLFVITPGQQVLGNPSVSRLFPGEVHERLPSGARIDFDKVSTQQGDYEICYWPQKNYKGGVYGIGAIHQDFRALDPKYDPISNVKIEVYLDGKKLDTVVTNPDAVREDGAAAVFGTTYRTRTNLDAGRDVVSTLTIIPDPAATRSQAAARSAPPRGRQAPRRDAEDRAGQARQQVTRTRPRRRPPRGRRRARLMASRATDRPE